MHPDDRTQADQGHQDQPPDGALPAVVDEEDGVADHDVAEQDHGDRNESVECPEGAEGGVGDGAEGVAVQDRPGGEGDGSDGRDEDVDETVPDDEGGDAGVLLGFEDDNGAEVEDCRDSEECEVEPEVVLVYWLVDQFVCFEQEAGARITGRHVSSSVQRLLAC